MGALTISLDGTENSHNTLRNHPASFKSAVNAIKLASSSQRLNFDVVSCIHPGNLNQLEDICKLLVSLKVPAWRLFTIAPVGRAEKYQDLMLDRAGFEQLMRFISQKRKTETMQISFSCESYTAHWEKKVRNTRFFCRAGINIGSVLADGSISACPNIDRSFSQGNIYRDNFYDIWQNSFDLFRNRNWTKTGICSQCSDYQMCLGNGLHLRKKEGVMVCRGAAAYPPGSKNP